MRRRQAGQCPMATDDARSPAYRATLRGRAGLCQNISPSASDPMLSVILYVLAVTALLSATVFLLFIRPARRRRLLVRRRTPARWQFWIAEAVPHYSAYALPWRRLLEDRVKVFVAEKKFYGCDGQRVEDRHRVIIAAQACLLSLAHAQDSTDAIRAILLYPSAFRVPESDPDWLTFDQDGVPTAEDNIHLGESWEDGRVILSWADIENGLAARKAGEQPIANVVLHEFAHQFDQLHGISAAMAVGGAGVAAELKRAFAELGQKADAGLNTLLDPYGASAPAEFVAVLAETFFEHPLELQHVDPALYEAARHIYRFDLAAQLRQTQSP